MGYQPGEACAFLLAGNYQRLALILKDCMARKRLDDPALIGEDKVHVFNLAAKLGDMQGLRALLTARFPPNRLYNGFYVLHSAAMHGHTPAVTLLAQWKSEVNARNAQGQTALMAAVINGHTSTCEALVRLGAEVNARNAQGQTALMAAAINGHTGTCEALVRLGAEVNACDHLGRTALSAALFKGHGPIRQLLERAGALAPA